MAKSKRHTQKELNSSYSNSQYGSSVENNSVPPIIVYKQPNGTYSHRPYLTRQPQGMTIGKLKSYLPFKKKDWISKFRTQEKFFRNSKNMKNLSKDLIDGISYKAYQDLEAGISVLPKKKFCDYTGFETNYTEINTGIRFYNSQIYKIFQNMSQPVKDQYLNIRKALIRLK